MWSRFLYFHFDDFGLQTLKNTHFNFIKHDENWTFTKLSMAYQVWNIHEP